MGNGGQGDQGDRGRAQLEIDGKQYTVDDVKSLLGQSKDATEKSQKAQKIIDAAKSYGVEPEEFLQHAEGALGIVTRLRDEGIITSEGEIKIPKKEDKKDDLDNLLNLDSKESKDKKSGLDQAIQDSLAKIAKRMEGLEEMVSETRNTQTLMARLNQEEKIKAAYPNLGDGDIARVFAETAGLRKAGKKATLLEVAKLVSTEVGERTEEIKKQFAKDHGLDYDAIVKKKDEPKFDLEHLDEKGMAAITQSKKLSLFPKPGEDSVTPLDAVRAFEKLT